MNECLKISKFNPRRIVGPSPQDDSYYVLILFDISDQKKYRLMIKELKRYSTRIQKSVFEGQLRKMQFRDLCNTIKKIMTSERFYDADDSVRIYKIAGSCEAVAYGPYKTTILEENIFI